jgi:hypothetical protein
MEIGFAPEMIAPTAIKPHIFSRVIASATGRANARPMRDTRSNSVPQREAGLLRRVAPRNDGSAREAGMTAYLISLALAGLVVIVLWEGLS